ncbi:MAG: FixH family protein [Rhodobacteraceae bacterium]|nr:FixH family protein [Paracoccaceae bacterium]
MSDRTLRGQHVFLMIAGAFGIIVIVNIVMAFAAIRTFPGMEVRNSYIASQTFERDRTRQEQLGWQASADYDGSILTITVAAADGVPAEVVDFSARIQRPTHQLSDRMPEYIFDGTHHRARITLKPGTWNIHVTGSDRAGLPFRQKLSLWVTDRQG